MSDPQLQENIAQLDRLAETLYTSHDPAERQRAEASLRGFSASADFIPQCSLILDNSSSPFALHLASSSLFKLFTTFFSTFSPGQTVDIRNYILNYLATRVAALPPFVSKSLVQLVCRVTKLTWNEADAHREFLSEVSKLLPHSTRHYILGMHILAELVHEMNTPVPNQSLTVHRKVAVSFRDLSLLSTFQLSVTTLQRIHGNQITFADEAERESLRMAALEVALRALSFDFIGTNPDDASDDAGTIQVPAPWRAALEDSSLLRLMFDMFASCGGDSGSLIMQVLVQLSSLRRSLFATDETRNQFLLSLLVGTVAVMKQSQRLAESDSYLHFCRLLGRLKANYQLAELVKMDVYSEWIGLLASFTDSSFTNYETCENGIHYLLSLWSRLTVSIPFMRGDMPTHLNVLVPRIFRSFVTMRLSGIQKLVVEGGAEEIFDELTMEEQMRNLPTLARLNYVDSAGLVVAAFGPTAENYQKATESCNAPFIRLYETQLAWLIHIVASLVSSQAQPGSDIDASEALDAELVARVFRLIQVIEFRQTSQAAVPVQPALALAMIKFFTDIRRQFIGNTDSISRPSALQKHDADPFDMDGGGPPEGRRTESTDPPIYARLAVHLGPVTQGMLLSSILTKVVADLKYFSNNAAVIKECLALLADLSSGYNSSKLMVCLDITRAIISSHGVDNFPFMSQPVNFKARTVFYGTLSRLVFAESNLDLFEPFLQPFERTFAQLHAQADMRTELSQSLGIGLLRDMRGVVRATCNNKTYSLFFDWFFPSHWETLLRLLDSCWDLPAVVIPFLRLLSELVFNKSQRINFDVASPNGLLLFKETSKCLLMYGTRILTIVDRPVNDLYKERYKGLSLVMLVLSRALSGGFCPFGVFALYQDGALSASIDIAVKIILFMQNNYEAYPKVSKIYYGLLEIMFRNHTPLMAELDARVIQFLLTSLVEGVQHHDVTQSSLAATALDHIFSQTWRLGRKRVPGSAHPLLVRHLTECGALCQKSMNMLLNTVIFENISHNWALCRPIFSLLLVNDSAFAAYKQLLVQSQPAEHQARVVQALDEVMAGIQPSLDAQFRDKFTANLLAFKTQMAKVLIRPPV